MNEFNKYMKRALNEAIMHNDPKFIDAVKRGQVLAPKENQAEYAKPITGIPNIMYGIYDNNSDLQLVDLKTASYERNYMTLIKNPTQAQFNELGLNGSPRAVIFKGNLYVCNSSYVHRNILELLQQTDSSVNFQLGRMFFNIEKDNFSCWQIGDDENTFYLSESYQQIYRSLASSGMAYEMDNEYGELDEIKDLILQSVDSLPGHVKSEFNFKLKVYMNFDRI